MHQKCKTWRPWFGSKHISNVKWKSFEFLSNQRHAWWYFCSQRVFWTLNYQMKPWMKKYEDVLWKYFQLKKNYSNRRIKTAKDTCNSWNVYSNKKIIQMTIWNLSFLKTAAPTRNYIRKQIRSSTKIGSKGFDTRRNCKFSDWRKNVPGNNPQFRQIWRN